jgi:hypothetical protein
MIKFSRNNISNLKYVYDYFKGKIIEPSNHQIKIYIDNEINPIKLKNEFNNLELPDDIDDVDLLNDILNDYNIISLSKMIKNTNGLLNVINDIKPTNINTNDIVNISENNIVNINTDIANINTNIDENKIDLNDFKEYHFMNNSKPKLIDGSFIANDIRNMCNTFDIPLYNKNITKNNMTTTRKINNNEQINERVNKIFRKLPCMSYTVLDKKVIKSLCEISLSDVDKIILYTNDQIIEINSKLTFLNLNYIISEMNINKIKFIIYSSNCCYKYYFN